MPHKTDSGFAAGEGPAPQEAPSLRGHEELQNTVDELRRDNQALRAANAELRDYYDHAPDMHVSLDVATGHVVDCNETLLGQLGYAREEVLGLPVFDLYEPRCRQRAKQCIAELCATGEVRDEPLTLRRADGGCIEVLLNATAICDESGQVVRSRSVWRDITHVMRVDEDIRRLSTIVESSDDAILSKNLNGKITSWNDGAQRIYGYTGEEMVGQSVKRLIPPDKISEYEDIMAHIYRNERVKPFETQRVRQDGSIVDVSLSVAPIHSASGGVVGASAIARDITQLKKVQRAANRRSKRTRSIVESALDAIVTINERSEVTRWNPQAAAIFGYSKKEAIGARLPELVIPPAQREAHLRGMRQYLAGGEGAILGKRLELFAVNKAGDSFPVELTIVANHFEEGIEFTAFVRDITERHRSRAQIQKEIDRRDRFLAMVSHELRNPMGAVINALELVHGEESDEHDRQTALQIVDRQTRHMARLLDDLLDVSRITQNKITYQREVVELDQTVEEVVQAVEHLIDAKDQRLSIEVFGGPLRVWGDGARLRQVQLNLLTNASKYTPVGGRIELALRRNAKHVEICVRDSGVGISPELLKHVFDVFVQSDDSLHRTGGGMGLGLAITKSIVLAHRGTITAHSPGAGQGSQFTVRLPVSDREPTATPQSTAPPTFSGRRLLLAEDNDDARQMLAKILRQRGFEVFEAADGGEAIDLFRSSRPEVAVIDIGLPHVDGYGVAGALRDHEAGGDVLLVALTGYGRDSDRLATKEAGFDAHLVKPLNPAELFSLLASRLAQRATT